MTKYCKIEEKFSFIRKKAGTINNNIINKVFILLFFIVFFKKIKKGTLFPIFSVEWFIELKILSEIENKRMIIDMFVIELSIYTFLLLFLIFIV